MWEFLVNGGVLLIGLSIILVGAVIGFIISLAQGA